MKWKKQVSIQRKIFPVYGTLILMIFFFFDERNQTLRIKNQHVWASLSYNSNWNQMHLMMPNKLIKIHRSYKTQLTTLQWKSKKKNGRKHTHTFHWYPTFHPFDIINHKNKQNIIAPSPCTFTNASWVRASGQITRHLFDFIIGVFNVEQFDRIDLILLDSSAMI